MRADFTLYTPEYISGVMSLRKPQKKSLEILDIIVNSVNLKKGMNLHAALVAVKAERDLNDPDVIAKKKRGILYCVTVTHWSEANGYKPWKYLFIPVNQIYPNSTFMMIAKKFVVTE